MTSVSQIAEVIAITFSLVFFLLIPMLWLISMFKPGILRAKTRMAATKRAAIGIAVSFLIIVSAGIVHEITQPPEEQYAELMKAVSDGKLDTAVNRYHDLLKKKDAAPGTPLDLDKAKADISALARQTITASMSSGNISEAKANLELASTHFLTAAEKADFEIRIKALTAGRDAKVAVENELARYEQNQQSHQERQKEFERELATKRVLRFDTETFGTWPIYGIIKLDDSGHHELYDTDLSGFGDDFTLMQRQKSLAAVPYSSEDAAKSNNHCIMLKNTAKLLDGAEKIEFDQRFMLATPGSGNRYPVCKIVSGKWHDAITDSVITNADDIRYEFIVPMEEMKASGLERTSQSQRWKMISEQVLITSAQTVSERDGGGLDAWVPDDEYVACTYIERYASFKMDYGLSFTEDEFDVIDDYHAEDVTSDDQRTKECFIDAVYEKGIIDGRLLGSGDRRSDVRIRD